MKVEVLDRLSDCNIFVMLVPLASALQVGADLQLWDEERPALIPGSCVVFFVQRAIVSLEAPLYGLTVVKNNTVSDNRNISTSKYCFDVENGHNFGYCGNAPKTSGFF